MRLCLVIQSALPSLSLRTYPWQEGLDWKDTSPSSGPVHVLFCRSPSHIQAFLSMFPKYSALNLAEMRQQSLQPLRLWFLVRLPGSEIKGAKAGGKVTQKCRDAGQVCSGPRLVFTTSLWNPAQKVPGALLGAGDAGSVYLFSMSWRHILRRTSV